MINIKVVSKDSHNVLSETTTQDTLSLVEPSVVILNVSKESIASIKADGLDAVVQLNDGQTITIKDFFAADNTLVLEGGDKLLWVQFTDDTGAFLNEVVYNPLSEIKPLLYKDGVPAWAWIPPLAALGALNFDKSIKSSNDKHDTTLESAEKAVKDAVDAYQKAKDKLDAALKDGLITPTEKAEIENAIAEAEKAKQEANDKLNALADGEQKNDLEQQLNALPELKVPPINDKNENGIADDIDAAIDDAEQAVKDAQEKYDALEKEIEGKGGIINPEDKAALDQSKEELDAAIKEAEDLVNALPDQPASVQEKKDQLTDDLNNLKTPGITVPEVNDQDGNGIDDSVEAAIDDAEQAVKDAQEKYDALEKEIEGKGGIINPEDKAALDQSKEELDAAIKEAEDLVNALPDQPASVQDKKDQLTDDLNNLKTPGITVPEVNDQDGNGIDDSVEAAIDDAEQAVKDAQEKYDALEKEIEGKGGIINPEDKAALDQSKEELDAAIKEAEDLVNALPDQPASVQDKKDQLTDDLNNLKTPGITVPEVNDQDSNGTPDDQDAANAADAIAKVKEAELAYKDLAAEITKAEADGG
ncbi:BapA prefix-like domain-containing protein, partial [Acinetobacter sp. YH01004]|uniref:GA-like domain-containing protein n=1 Tax=Acinetobacter sp. YH01004 TaxID=2601020 RepID=UPI0015D117E5